MTISAPERPRVEPDAPPEHAPPVASRFRSVVAGALATAAAAWMAGGLFRGSLPRALALAGVLLGAGVVGASLRTRRPAAVQYLALPVAVVVGALLVLPETGPGEDIVSLIGDALRGGGLAQPPVAFDPGWRFVLFVFAAVTAAAAGTLALGSGRPKLAVAVPVPVLLGAALLQPEGGEVTAGAPAIALLLAALAVAYGGELGTGAARADGGFETRRLARGGVLVVLVVVALAGLNRANVLFPETTTERVVPAQRPPAGGGVGPDRVLFTVDADGPGPWRTGVLDVYDGTGWLLPPFDPSRLVPVENDVPGAIDAPETTAATFEVFDVPGHVIPAPANAVAVGIEEAVEIDPRTGILRLPETRARAGLRYTITAPVTPGGRALADAPPPASDAAPFLEAPPAPNEVVALLADAPQNLWDRLVFVRDALFANAVAAGQGRPVDVPPSRVAAILGGAEATPYEITAAEALLARWAGVPSRIGFGFYAGDERDGVLEVRPRHGATWLEVAFEGHGWVPVVGVPPRARSSLTPAEQQENPNILPTDELALIVHVPIELSSNTLLFVTVRWWLARVLPVAAGLLLAWSVAPGLLKLLRSYRRRRWARGHGAAARITVAYAELRDAATDLGIGDRTTTPVGFLGALDDDDEHAELAWLVTRALWGDLRRDLHDDDAERAEAMARSVLRRMRRAQPGPARVAASVSRASLRDPWTPEVPAVAWPRLRPLLAGSLLVVLGACAQAVTPGVGDPGSLPARLAPASVGDLVIARAPAAEEAYDRVGDASLVHEGRVLTVERDEVVEAYIQVASFVGGVNALDEDVADGVLGSIGLGTFRLERLGEERVWVQQQPEARMYLTFTPDGEAFTLMIARRTFVDAEDVFVDVLRHQRGDPLGARAPAPPAYDPRRGTQ